MTADGGRRRVSEGRLVDRPEFFERLVRSTSDAVIAFDVEGTVLFANDASVHVFGRGSARLVGTDVAELLPDRFRDWFRESLADYVETGRRSFDWNGAEFVIERADGTELPVSVTLAEHVHDGRRVFSAVVRDVSASVERREELARRLAAADDPTVDPADLRHRLAAARTAIDRAREGLAGDSEFADGPDGRAVNSPDVRSMDPRERVDTQDPDEALATAVAVLDDLVASLPTGAGGQQGVEGADGATRNDAGSLPTRDGGSMPSGPAGAADAGDATDAPGSETAGSGTIGAGPATGHESAPVSLSDVAAEAWADATDGTPHDSAPSDAMLRVDGFGTVDAPSDVLRRVLSGCFRVALGRGDPTVHVGLLDAVADDTDGASAPSTPGAWTVDADGTDETAPSGVTGTGFYVSVETSASPRDVDSGDGRLDADRAGETGYGRPSTAVAAAVRATAPSTWEVDVRRSADDDVRVAVRPG